MAQGGLIVPLFNLAAVYAEIAVITQGQAGGVHAVQQRPVVILATGAVPIGFLGAFVPQVDSFIDIIHEKIVPLPGHVPTRNFTEAEQIRRAKEGI